MLSATIPIETPQKELLQAPKNDWNWKLFVINISSVVISYWLAGLTGMVSNSITKPLRIVLLVGSLYYLFSMTRKQIFGVKGGNSWQMWVFILLNIYVIPFSFNFFSSFEKFFNLIPFLIYINYSILYLYRNIDKEDLLILILRVFNLVYGFPVIAFLFSGSLGEKDIYGDSVGGFANNHYGWACAMFLLTSLDLYRNDSSLSNKHLWFIRILTPLAIILLSISGSRSGYLTFSLGFLIFILRNSNTHLAIKLFSVLLVFLLIFQLYGDPESALNKRLNKTEKQLKEGESREKLANLCFESMSNYPETMLTGFGFYSFKEALLRLNPNYNPRKLKINLHNSYYELLFGSGYLIFVFFMVFFPLRTIWIFALKHSSKYVFLPPVILIPLFENNFNPGQFMFFPWFVIMFYYLHYSETQIPIYLK
ncbi:O-antigen ligase family protein [Xanthocytophaga agilis]|uniref:O-antigen ligase family protein n=1 Tax=Xanthocytophaga agilis TaxID=3048010 RepID=A0AAE3R6Y1_9BACT|nr:O-antigen ligase family protein [Xanthocytophaga agilis]MDJ1504335.1 O-antigen ligase family protein [Xanthocytophaga agilis]